MADPLIIEEVDVPVDWVDNDVETVLRMIVLLITVEHLGIVAIDLVDPEHMRVALDFLGVGVLGHRH